MRDGRGRSVARRVLLAAVTGHAALEAPCAPTPTVGALVTPSAALVPDMTASVVPMVVTEMAATVTYVDADFRSHVSCMSAVRRRARRRRSGDHRQGEGGGGGEGCNAHLKSPLIVSNPVPVGTAQRAWGDAWGSFARLKVSSQIHAEWKMNSNFNAYSRSDHNATETFSRLVFLWPRGPRALAQS
jgi:hypothetical protein